MSNKRTLQFTSPEYTEKNNSKKFLQNNNMANQTNPQDVFSWDKLCSLLDDKLKDVTRKSDLVELKSDIEELKEENKKLKNDVKKLTHRLETIDRRSRSSNVMVAGLSSNNIHTAKTEFLKLCSDMLKININIMSTRMIAGGRSFCFTLETSMQAYNVISAKRKLDGQNIFIQKDYTEEEQNVRYNLRQISKNIAKHDKSIKVRLGEFCIFINNNKYTWSNGKILTNSDNNAEYLSKLLADCNYPIEVCVIEGRNDKTLRNEKFSTQ